MRNQCTIKKLHLTTIVLFYLIVVLNWLIQSFMTRAHIPPTFPNMKRYVPIAEYIFVLSKGVLSTFNPLRDKPNKSFGRVTTATTRQRNGSTKAYDEQITIAEFGLRTNIWRYNTGMHQSAEENYTYNHPAIFPESLAYDCIYSWSNPGDIVLDPMMGSGTTGKIAVKYDRRFIGIECSEKYFNEIAVPRIKSVLNNQEEIAA